MHDNRALAGADSDIDRMLWTYRLVVDIAVVSFLCLVGFVGNGLTIVILRSDRDKNSTTNWLLQSLAVVDIVYLVTCVFIQPLKAVHFVTMTTTTTPGATSGDVGGNASSSSWWVSATSDALHRSFTHLEPYIWTLASIAETVTIWIVLFVTVDRYIAICLPLRSKMRTMSRARAAVFAVIIVAVIYNIPVLFERRVVYPGDSVGIDGVMALDVRPTKTAAASAIKAEATELRRNTWYFVIYKTVCYFLFRKIGPLLVLIGLNARLMRALREMRRRHKYLTRRNRQRENVTMTLVVVVSVFIVCELPDVCFRVAVTAKELELGGEHFDDRVLQFGALPTTNALLTLNSAVNFFIYCLIGHKFRRILIRTVQSWCDRKKAASSHQLMTVGGGPEENGAACCGCGSTVRVDGQRKVDENGDDDDDALNGFATPAPSMMTRTSIAMTTVNQVTSVGNVAPRLLTTGGLTASLLSQPATSTGNAVLVATPGGDSRRT